MLSKEQKEKLREIHIYELSDEEKNGVAITRKTVKKIKRGKENISHIEEVFIIPSTYAIVESVFKQILDCGFSKVERVSPTDANCIVRVFKKLHHKTEFNIVFNMYGADVFVENGKDWIAGMQGYEYTLDYAKHPVGQWLCQDELVIFDTEFVDFYIKVS